MNSKEREALLKAGEKIASGRKSCICYCLPEDIELHDIPEAKMLDPKTVFWWGLDSMDNFSQSDICREARLLGIAMMLTMPKEFVDNTL